MKKRFIRPSTPYMNEFDRRMKEDFLPDLDNPPMPTPTVLDEMFLDVLDKHHGHQLEEYGGDEEEP